MLISIRRPAPAPTEVYDAYWRFAAERQRIMFARIANTPPPWTNDPILMEHRFTNAYRASDRVSQYLISRVIYQPELSDDPTEVFFRTLLFKIFNKIETWELLSSQFGPANIKEFSAARYAEVLAAARQANHKVYSAAYIMPSGTLTGSGVKHENHLLLLERMIKDEFLKRLCDAKSLGDIYSRLLKQPMLGPFLAFQFTVDLNYSAHFKFSEMDFVVAGPGAISGIRKCFKPIPELSDVDLIKWTADRQAQEFGMRRIDFPSLYGRSLQLIDCQNLFCEIDKYSRVAFPKYNGPNGRTRLKRKFTPDLSAATPFYPPHWGLTVSV